MISLSSFLIKLCFDSSCTLTRCVWFTVKYNIDFENSVICIIRSYCVLNWFRLCHIPTITNKYSDVCISQTFLKTYQYYFGYFGPLSFRFTIHKYRYLRLLPLENSIHTFLRRHDSVRILNLKPDFIPGLNYASFNY